MAIYTRNIQICNLIIESNVDINSKSYTGETTLHIACNLEFIDGVKLLIKNDIDINAQDSEHEFTALSYCVNRNNSVLSAILLKNNANPNIQDYYGNTPIHYAIIENNYEIFLQLIGSNFSKDIININLYNAESQLPIHLALESEKRDEYLLKLINKSNLNFQDNSGNSPLHYIIKLGLWDKYKEVIKKKKVNIFLTNKLNKRPIDYVKNDDLKNFIEIVGISYVHYLRNKPYVWHERWQNICKNELFYGKIEDKELKEIEKLVKIDKSDKNNDICYKLVTKKLLDIASGKEENQGSFPYKQDYVKVNINEGVHMEFCTFTGITLDILIGLIIILKKYDSVCSTLTSNFQNNENLCKYYKQLGIVTESKCEFLNFELTWVYQKLFLSDNFYEIFKKCTKDDKKRFIIIPLGIELREGSHANYLIYDKKSHELERFEPHGSDNPFKFNYNPHLLDNVLKSRLESSIDNLKYIAPKDYLPKIGFQIFDSYESSCRRIGDPKGFCALWSIWYTDMRLKYPDLDRKTLVKEIIRNIKNSNISFKNMIRNYSRDIIEMRDLVLKKASININDWLNDQYNDKQMKIVLDELKKIILSI